MSITTRAADYIVKLCIKEETHPEQIAFYPQKVDSCLSYLPKKPQKEKKYDPEEVGISSSYMESYLHALEEEKRTHLHNLLVSCDMKTILSTSAPGYSTEIWSLTHSMAKTLTSFGIALMIKEGKLSLDTKMTEVFADENHLILNPKAHQITVRHLLTMTAGITAVSETASVTITDWKDAFLTAPVQTAPGSTFFYNSMNSYMLACIVEKVSGKKLENVLMEGLFRPMGISHVYFEKGPEGIAKGGWGMFIRPQDMLKLGQLVLHMGAWEGKQLLPKAYMQEATKAQVLTDPGYGDYNYGFHMWVSRDGTASLFNGMLGQNIWVNHQNNMVVVSTTGNDEFYQVSTTLDITKKYFGGSFAPKKPTLPNPMTVLSYRTAEQNFFAKRALLPLRGKHEDYLHPAASSNIPKDLAKYYGAFSIEQNNVGLLPLFYRLMQNNHSDGLSTLKLEQNGKDLLLEIGEGAVTHRIACGYEAYKYTELNFKGEHILAGCSIKLCYDEDEEEVLRIDLVFPELPNSRRFKIRFKNEHRISLSLTETPGIEILSSGFNSIATNMKVKPEFIRFIETKMDEEHLQYRFAHTMEPLLWADRVLS